ncbi:MAG TPA: SDR family oxidoreductase [Sandaracinaceae bacterium LLY-WYZ-13_1]|nr:SDR family oxidoreductase [Sandaracinaceae bacterium LLY-WYZ-13_1]
MAHIVITGANRGIGLELARQRTESDRVTAVCRAPSDELKALGVRIEAGVDVTDDAAVGGLAKRLEGERVDVLINNAGILRRETLDDLDFDSIRQQLEVNALGPLRVSAALAPLMGEGGKIAIITSRMGSIGDNTSGSRYGYRMSKAAVNMAGVSLAHDLADRGISVAILHPGFVRTEMTGRNGNVEPAEAAAQLWARIDALEPSTSGTFWHANGERLPW